MLTTHTKISITNNERGTLTSGVMGKSCWKNSWSLDALGNWDTFIAHDGDCDTTSTKVLDQIREASTVNEITDITRPGGSSLPDWPTPSYDAVGNMTQFVKPTSDPEDVDLSAEFKAIYDGWNRLVELQIDDSGWKTYYRYEYDGRSFRTKKLKYNSAGTSVDETIHAYYNSSWQLLEERVDSATTPIRSYVWGQRYIDDLVLSERTVDSTDYTLYALNDANFNTVGLFDPTADSDDGAVVERYEYDAYGNAYVLDEDWDQVPYNLSAYDWDIRYASYRWDAESELCCVRNRYYHPTLGVWLSRDPIGYAGGLNLYEYADCEPVGQFDPLGTDCDNLPISPDKIYNPAIPLEEQISRIQFINQLLKDRKLDNSLRNRPGRLIDRGCIGLGAIRAGVNNIGPFLNSIQCFKTFDQAKGSQARPNCKCAKYLFLTGYPNDFKKRVNGREISDRNPRKPILEKDLKNYNNPNYIGGLEPDIIDFTSPPLIDPKTGKEILDGYQFNVMTAFSPTPDEIMWEYVNRGLTGERLEENRRLDKEYGGRDKWPQLELDKLQKERDKIKIGTTTKMPHLNEKRPIKMYCIRCDDK